MKRIIALILAFAMVFTGCSKPQNKNQSSKAKENPQTNLGSIPEEEKKDKAEFASLSDKNLLLDVEDLVYKETIEALDSEDYVVENVSAVYISKEYLEETAFNSQANVYFGYTLAELNEVFGGDSYIFTLGDDGKTKVQKLQAIDDDKTQEMIRNVAIGTGVILVCVTVSAVSAGSSPALSMIFAASAKTVPKFAATSAAFGGISAGLVRGIETGDFGESMEAAALAASKGFKWGAITGAVTGGGKTAFELKSATMNGLTMNEAARIQKDSKWPMKIISELKSFKEYEHYKQAGLMPIRINGRLALVQNIDFSFKSKLPDGSEVTNLIRMKKGYAPIEPATGKAYELHHIGQKSDGTLAVLTNAQHHGNNAILHTSKKASEIDRLAFNKVRKNFWQDLAKQVLENGGI